MGTKFSYWQPPPRPVVADLEPCQQERFLLEQVRHVNLLSRRPRQVLASDMQFNSNDGFWQCLLFSSRIPLNWVELKGFQITDWFPRTPGIYHTPGAQEARRKAQDFIVDKGFGSIFDPFGKYLMILDGGVGSLRFKPLKIDGDTYWLCTATSDGYCHSGIPLAIPEGLIAGTTIGSNQFYTIRGQIRFLPEFLEKFFPDTVGVPQIYVSVDALSSLGSREGDKLVVTPAVSFKRQASQFVTYVSCNADSNADLDKAAEWLFAYASSYEGEVITNFDQQRPTFRNAPFSVHHVMEEGLDKHAIANHFHIRIEHAELFSNYINSIQAGNVVEVDMSRIEVNIGDGTVIHGDFAVAHSIKDSFNKAHSSDAQPELKDLLKDLAKEIGKISETLDPKKAGYLAQDLNQLVSHATSELPRKEYCKVSLSGIKEAAAAVGEVGATALGLIARISSFLGVV